MKHVLGITIDQGVKSNSVWIVYALGFVVCFDLKKTPTCVKIANYVADEFLIEIQIKIEIKFSCATMQRYFSVLSIKQHCQSKFSLQILPNAFFVLIFFRKLSS